MRAQRRVPEGDVPIAALVPTQRYDMQLIGELADTVRDFSRLDARVLLLGGSRSPAYLGVALDELAAVLPRAQRITLRSLGHSGPDDDGDPLRVSRTLHAFFAS